MKKFTFLIALMAFLAVNAFGQSVSTTPAWGAGNIVTVCQDGTVDVNVISPNANILHTLLIPGSPPTIVEQITSNGSGDDFTFTTLNFPSTGTTNYTVSAVDYSLSVNFGVVVIADPTAPILNMVPASPVCAGTTINPTLNTSGSGGVGCSDRYESSIDGGGNWSAYTLGTGLSTTGLSGTDVVQIKAITDNISCSACGCYAENIYKWTVNALADPALTGEVAPCFNSVETYSTDAGMSSYNWSVSSNGTITGGTGTDQITVNWNGSLGGGTVSVYYDDGSSCTSNTTLLNVSVKALPNPSLITPTTVVCAGSVVTYTTQSGFYNYSWNITGDASFTGGTSSDYEATVTWGATSPGTVSVNYENSDGCEGATDALANITINALPTVSAISLQSSIGTQAAGPVGPWMATTGALGSGYTLPINPNAEYYFMDIDALTASLSLEVDFLNPFYLDETSVPAGFYTYWAGKNVYAGCTGTWEPTMWLIINGNAPMFYIKYTGSDYQLIDGLQYQVSSGTIESEFRINGEYPLGSYDVDGTVKSTNGCTSDEFSIDMTFTPGVVNITQSTGFDAIQDAIDHAATTTGDQIYAAAKTYTENVTINESVILTGADNSTTFIDGDGSGIVVTINVNDVTIEGFTIQNSGSNSAADAGILLYGTSDCSVLGNIVNANSLATGIALVASTDNIIQGNTSSNNLFGIVLDIGGGSPSNTNTIIGNTFNSSTGNGIYLGEGCSGNYIGWDPILSAINLNYASGNTADGIFLWKSGSNTITGNIVNNNGGPGIHIFASPGNSVSQNTITNNDKGIYIRSGWTENEPHTSGWERVSSGNLINNNDISGNSAYGIEYDQNSYTYDDDILIDATSNWWGNASGPSGEGPGTGDAVSTFVDFCPWLDGPIASTPSTHALVKNLDTGEEFCTIQEAINAVLTDNGDVIQISKGMYPERVIVSKQLTIQGVSEANCIIDGSTQIGNGDGIFIQNGVTNVTIQYLTVQNFSGANGNTDAGIYATAGNDHLNVNHVTIQNNVGGSGFYANGPIDDVTLDYVTASGHTSSARGILIWNGYKTNITITNCEVFNNSCCGLELQDGTASNVTITGNYVHDNADNGLGLMGMTDLLGPCLVDDNIVANNGRYGIEIKNPDGGVTVSNNTVSLAATVAMNNRDHAGIAVFRRSFQAGNPDGYTDVPNGVTVTGNTVSGYTQLNPTATTSEGFGIVVEGVDHSVSGNILDGNDVALQLQGGGHPNPNYTYDDSGDGNQSDGMSASYFGRGNAPFMCNITVGTNTFGGTTANGIDTRMVVEPLTPITDAGIIASQVGVSVVLDDGTTQTTYCSIQGAVDRALGGQTPEEIITASASTFVEDVLVDKSVILLGANAGIPFGSRGAESIIQPVTSGGPSITLGTSAPDNVTINGFEITGQYSENAIYCGLYGPNDLDIKFNYFHDIGTLRGSQNVYAVNYRVGADNRTNVNISDNYFDGILNHNVSTNGKGSSAAIWMGQSNAQGNVSNVTIERNVIKNVRSNLDAKLFEASPYEDVGKITSSGIYIGVAWRSATYNGQVSAPSIKENEISNVIGGIVYGIQLSGVTPGAIIENNAISNISSPNSPQHEYAVGVPSSNTGTGILVNTNSLTNTLVGVINGRVSNQIDATCNWWGSNDAGDVAAKVSGDVQFLEYLIVDNTTPGTSYWWDTGNAYSCDGIGPVTNTEQGTSYMTIQDGIDDASTTVKEHIVASDGIYPENVIIDKSLFLWSENDASTTKITGSGGTAISITADEVEINGFEITNPSGTNAIYATDHSNITIVNNDVNDIGTTAAAANVHAIAIVSSAAAVNNINISSNIVSNINMLALDGSSNGKSAFAISTGWTTGDFDITNLVIEGNIISNINSNTGAWPAGHGAYGILLSHAVSGAGTTIGAQVINNEITDLEGLWAHGIGLEGNTPNAIVKNNYIDDLTDYKTEKDACAIMVEQNASAASLLISENSFTNVDAGVRNVTGIQVDITCNWFGTTNPITIAGLVDGVVNVVSYLTNGDDDLPLTVGFQPTTGSCGGVFPVKNITQTTYFATIQAAINAASTVDLDVIEASDGLYIESNILVDKDLTIQGESRAGVIVAPAAEDVGDGLSGTDGTPQNGFIISHDGVTIRNLTVDGNANNLPVGALPDHKNFRDGITCTDGFNDLLVEDVTVNNLRRRGINLWYKVPSVTDQTIRGCHVEEADNYAIRIGADNSVLENNTANNCGLGMKVFIWDMNSDPSKVSYITGNTLTNVGIMPTMPAFAAGYYCEAFCYYHRNNDRTVIIRGNSVTPRAGAREVIAYKVYNSDANSFVGGPDPLHANIADMTNGVEDNLGLYLGGCAGTTVQNNSFTLMGKGRGMVLGRGGPDPLLVVPNLITMNTITTSLANNGDADWQSCGIIQSNDPAFPIHHDGWAEDPQHVFNTITYNTITNFKRGIYFNRIDHANTTDADINYNTIENNELYGFDNSLNITEVNAENNWWGDASGPENDPYNTCGMGNEVAGPVDFMPWWMTPTGPGSWVDLPVYNTNEMTYYCKIQDAINDPLTLDGHTITVAAGIYPELIYFDKSLTLLGPNYLKTGTDVSRDPEAIITFPTGLTDALYTLITVGPEDSRSDIDDVVIKGFTIDGNTTETFEATGIIGNGDGLVVENNIITNFNYVSVWVTSYVFENGGWINDDYNENTIIKNNYIHNDDIFNDLVAANIPLGIYLQGTYGSVTGNTVEKAVSGIQVQPYNHPNTNLLTGVVSDNTFEGYNNAMWYNNSNNASADWLISGNTLSGILPPSAYTPGADWYGEPTDIWYGFAINGNSFGELAFTGNTIEKGTTTLDAYGIRYVHGYAHAPATTITGNTINDLAYGVYLPVDLVNVGEIAINDNTISGNSQYGVYNGTSIAVDATPNYWGAATGPYHDPSNTCGDGNPVSDNVDFVPWWTDAAMTATSGDLAVHNTTKSTYYCSIQDAIDDPLTDDGDIITVAAGTYPEVLYIYKELDIRGPNYGINPNTGMRNPEATIQFPPANTSWYMVYIDGDGGGSTVTDVSLNGFEFDGVDSYGGTYPTELIFVSGAENVTIKNNILKNFEFTAIRYYYQYWDGASYVPTWPIGADISENHIFNPDFYSLGSIAPNTGIYMQGVYGSVTDNVVEQVLGGCQIQPYGHPNTTPVTGNVTGNAFKGSRNGLWYNNSSSINADWLFSGNTLSGIPFPTGYTPGADWYGEPTDIWYGFAINGNSFGELAFTDNTIEKGTTTLDAHGIRYVHGYAHAPTSTITGNTINDLDYGVYLPVDLVNVAEIAINDNSISGNSQYGVYNGTSTAVAATPNWWGDATGPFHAVNNTCGLGNAVTDDVDFMPWYTNVGMTTLSVNNPLVDGTSPVCAGAMGIAYETTAYVGYSYLWNVIGGTIASGQGTNAITVNWADIDPGTVTVTQISTAPPYCAQSASKTVTIVALPTPEVVGNATPVINSSETYYTANYAGHFYTWSVIGGTITGGQNSSAITVLWPGTPGAGTITVTEINLATGCVGVSNVFNVTITPGGVVISGVFTYHNTGNSPLVGLSLDLMQGTTVVGSTTTAAAGYYEFNNVMDGTYTVAVTTTKTPGGINAIDAGGVNYWFTHKTSIEHVKWNAGDVNLAGDINATDAGVIQKYFVYDSAFIRGEWTFWKQSDASSLNPPTSTNDIVVSGSSVTQGFYGMCVGDFNGSNSSPGKKSPFASDLMLTYDGSIMMNSSMEFELPIKVAASMQVAALSLILEIPSNFVTVEDVFINNGNVPSDAGALDFNIVGDELRIGWNSMQAFDYSDGNILLTLKLRTTADFGKGDVIEIALTPSPLNELADGTYQVIDNVVLSTYTVEYSVTGIGELELSKGTTLKSIPNPFNEVTYITYSIPVDGEVKLDIYNMYGSLVNTLVDDTQSKGEYRVKFHALGHNAGVYTVIIHVKANGHVVSRSIKMVLNSN